METKFETILTNSYKEEMIAYVLSHPTCFKEGIELAIADKQPYSWRAAWLLWSCMNKNDKRVRPYIKSIIEVLPQRGSNQQRELLMILDLLEIDEDDEGRLFEACVNIWKDMHLRPSVRCRAFRTLTKIASHHPELIRELKLLAQDDYIESLSKAVKKVIGRLIGAVEEC